MTRNRAARAVTVTRSVAAIVVMVAALPNHPACAQVSLADDIILASQGGAEGQAGVRAEPESRLGPSPGSRAGPFYHSPGTSQVLLGGRIRGELQPIPSNLTRTATPSGLTSPSRGQGEPGRGLFQRGGGPPAGRGEALLPALPPIEAGQLEEPTDGDRRPAGGLTLDAAVERLVHTSLDLKLRAYEIPMAQADVLTAGLRENPLFFYDSSDVPYGSYSPQRPGEIEHGVSLVLPVDYNGKRRARVAVACQAKRVLEAQYQDAVRLQIDQLYAAFVDVLATQLAARYAESSRDSLARLVAMSRKRRGRGGLTEPEEEALDGLALESETADLLVRTETDRSRKARRVLAELLGLTAEEAQSLEVADRASRDAPRPLPLPVEDVVALARRHRPDLAAHRLGIERARADARLARADRLSDAYLLYTPFTYRDNSQVDARSAQSWGAGLFVSIPLFDRNQGNIRRSVLNIAQAETELANVDRRVVAEVRQAAQEHEDTRAVLERLDRVILPAIRRQRDRARRRLEAGTIDAETYLRSLRDHNSVVRLHRETIIRHRRSELALNTAVGLRLLP